MVNPRKAATTMAISLVAIGSLAFAGPATAEAMSSTAASHQTAGARPAAAQHIVCARHQAILREMRRTIAAYEDTSRSYAHLLGSARRAGQTKDVAYWTNVMAKRRAHELRHKANLAARRAKFLGSGNTLRSC